MMDIKHLFMPTMAKLALFLFLLLIGGYFGFFVLAPRVFGGATYGFPFTILNQRCSPPTGDYLQDVQVCAPYWDVAGMLLDVVWWYLVACAIIFVYSNGIKRKGDKK